jgi:hypothetical protein
MTSPPNKGKGAGIKWIRDHVGHDGTECLIWPFHRNPVSGHGYVGFNGRTSLAHRMMCRLAHGEPPTPGHEVAHECGNGRLGCINPSHLSWKTKSENQLDRRRHGTTGRGRKHKLTPQQVAEIRASSERVPILAARYGVTESNIRQILLHKTWKTGRYEYGGFSLRSA